MPKVKFTSPYLRDGPPTQIANYVKYIGTREGVEKKFLIAFKQIYFLGNTKIPKKNRGMYSNLATVWFPGQQ